LSRAPARVAWLIPKIDECAEEISVKADKTGKKQRQSVSERIIKKVKGNDAEQRRTKQRQHMANHRACETGKQRYQQVISITGSLLSVNIFVFSYQTPNCRLLASHIVHVSNACATLHAHVRILTLLATRGLCVKLHLV